MAGLEKLAEEMGVEYLAHRSDEDARVTLKLLQSLCEKENLSIKELLKKLEKHLPNLKVCVNIFMVDITLAYENGFPVLIIFCKE